eukprot:scaffold17712_cov111-Isochrysis_galbana.AAC.7
MWYVVPQPLRVQQAGYVVDIVQGMACGARAAAMLAHTVSLCDGVLRGLLERAKSLFAIVDLMSVNGTAFRQVRAACEIHTGVFCIAYMKRAMRI